MKPLTFRQRLSLILVFIVARIIDLLETVYGLSIGKTELNPLVHLFGIGALYLLDLALFVGFLVAARKVRSVAIDVFLSMFALLVVVGAVWNLFILF